MIIVKDLETNQKHSFNLIDCHHHIGEDVDGRKNLTYKGSLSFFRNIWKEIQRKYNDDLPDYFSPKFKMLSIEPPNIWKHLESNPLHKNSWVFDKFVAFPFHDKFRIDQSNPASDQITYRTSNVRLSKFMVDDKIYGRYIGWCRLDLHDGEKIIQELVDLVSKYGMKGLKLHPLSDDWNEPEFFQDPEGILIKTLLTATELNIPVIFDCRYSSTLKWITEATKIVETKLVQEGKSLAYIRSHLKVIVAHIGFLLNDADLLYKALSHPNIYGDLTGQFSNKTQNLLNKLREKIKPPKLRGFFDQNTPYWAQKLLMGTDYNYFEEFHIADQLLYLFSQDFYEKIDGNLSVLESIFCRNAERILPPIPNNIFSTQPPQASSNLILKGKIEKTSNYQILETISKIFSEQNWGKNPFYIKGISLLQDLISEGKKLDKGSRSIKDRKEILYQNQDKCHAQNQSNGHLQTKSNFNFLISQFKKRSGRFNNLIKYSLEWANSPLYAILEETNHPKYDLISILSKKKVDFPKNKTDLQKFFEHTDRFINLNDHEEDFGDFLRYFSSKTKKQLI